jgi:2-keto-4-pentenoate hydratase/2-oxohepta-3-ene-1,7-dioic acid hydratase in catechol pathway
MKLCRYGSPGQERPGLIDGEGRLRDLSRVKSRLTAADLSPESLAALASIDPYKLPLVDGTPRVGVPYEGISKFVCIGLNYSDHATESNLAIPSEPLVFMKATSALCGPNDEIIMPKGSTKLDWEVELAIVIGTTARYVKEQNALDYVAGYSVANDVSERAFQMQSSQWDKGKGCDSFGPLGPWLVTKDEIADPQVLDLWLEVNDERMQSGNTRDMIFDVPQLISYVSRFMTLLPGDVISTGTPAGVGMGKRPEPRWLRSGDRVRLGVEGLGVQSQAVVDWR